MATAVTTTVDFGATPVDSATFVVVDAGVSAVSYVEAFVMGDTTADNDVGQHQIASASFRLMCTPAAGSFTLDVNALFGLVMGTFKIRYVYSP